MHLSTVSVVHEANEFAFPVACDVFAKQNVREGEPRIGCHVACNHQELAIGNEITRIRVPGFHPQKVHLTKRFTGAESSHCDFSLSRNQCIAK
jgi:hypothetical protein